MWTILKVLLEFVITLLLFFCFFVCFVFLYPSLNFCFVNKFIHTLFFLLIPHISDIIFVFLHLTFYILYDNL